MKEELIEELVAYLKDAIEFGKEQMPSVVEQMIRKEIWQCSIIITVSVLLALASIKLARWGWNSGTDEDTEVNEELAMVAVIFGWIGTLTAVVLCIIHTISLGNVLIAPKVFILETLSRMVG